jgi:radical SAM protein with 4Fe4S-binding SPASM domain
VRLSPAEVVAFDLEPQRKAEYRQLLDRDLVAGPPPDGNDVYVCGGGVLSCSIDPYGQMSICVISKRTDYNVRNSGFEKGWKTVLRETRVKKRSRPSKCSSCQIRSMCGMCPANGELEHDDPESPVDFLCHVTHLRTMALGSEVPSHGDCEYCRGGSKYSELESEVRSLPQTVEQLSLPSPVLLPIIGSSASGCGLGKCGH